MSAILWVDYEEFKPDTYKGCIISSAGEPIFASRTGNFKKDMRACEKYAQRLRKELGLTVYNSSSVDNWYSDSQNPFQNDIIDAYDDNN